MKREQFIDALIEKEDITDLDQECTLELLEVQNKINFKKELLRQIEEKVAISLKNLEDAKRDQEKVSISCQM